MTYPNRPYCTHCGAQMTATPVSSGYNSKTGKRLYKIRFSCPRRRFWSPLHDAGFLGDRGGYTLLTEEELWDDVVVPEVGQ